MKLAFKKIAMLGLLSLAVLALVGCVTTTTTTTTTSGTTATTTTTSSETTTTTTLSDTDKVQAVLDALSLGDVSAIVADIDLPHPTTNGVTVTWASSNQDWVTNQGEITVPKYTEGPQTVTLTATVTLNAVTLTKTFDVTVATETLNTFLNRAGNAIIITGSDNITASFRVPAASLGATITWTSGNEDLAVISATATDGYYDVTITRPSIDDGGENTSVTLTATISYGEGSITMEKPIRIIAEAGSTHVTTIAAAMALGTGVYTTYEGMTVIGIESSSGTKTGFFFTDGTDIQFVYNAATAATVTVGGVYDITGSFVWYYNAPEVANDGANVVKVKASAAEAKAIPTTAATLAEAVGTRPTPTAENPAVYQAFTLTAKVMVIAGGRNGITTNTTYLVPADYDTSVALNPAVTPCIRVYYKSNMDAVTAASGQVVSITIMLQSYHTSYQDWYGDFFGTVDDIQVTFANDQDAIDAALATLVYPSSILDDTTLTLPAAAFGVSLSYASDNEAVINPTTGVVNTAGLTGQVTVTLTVTATRGSTTDTKVFTIKVGELPITQMSDVFNDTLIPKGNVIRIQGILTGATVATSYFIQDDTAGLDVYSSDATIQAWFASHIGQKVELIGVKDVYNGLYEIKTITSYSVIDANPTPVVPISLSAVVFTNANLLPYQARLVSFENYILTANPVVDSYGNVTFTLLSLANGNRINVKWDCRVGDVTALTAYLTGFHQGDSVSIVGGILNWSSNNPIIGLWNVSQVVAGTAATDADYANFDAMKFPSTLTLDTHYVFPTLSYATVAVKSISTELTGYVADGTTQLTVTNPAVTATGTVVLTLTYNTASVDVTIAVTVNALTDAQKLAADQASLSIAATANEFDAVTLPAAGTLGSAIAWEITAGGDNATLAAGVVTYKHIGAAYSVTLRATLTIGSETAVTKDFTVDVSPVTIYTISQILDMTTALGGASVSGSSVWMQGTVIGLKWKSGYTQYQGLYLSDGTDSIFVYKTFNPGDYVVGDVLLLKATYCTYYYLPEINPIVSITKVEGATPATYTPIVTTIADIWATSNTNIANPYYNQIIQVVGTVHIGTADSSSYLIDGAGNKLTFSYMFPSYTAAEVLALNGKEVTFTGILNDYHSTQFWRVTGAGSTFVLTEAQIAKDEIAALSLNTSVSSGDVVTLPVVAGTSSITWAMTANDYASLSGNTLTVNMVSATQNVTLTATFSHPVTGGDPIVTVKDYVFTISTPEAKLAADKDALTVADQVEMSTLTLPTTGSNGSAIAWTMDASENASISGNVVTMNYKGTTYQITLHATLTLGTFSDTKDITINVNPATVITELGALNKKTDGTNWDVANATGVFLRGVVIAARGTGGVWIQDADGDGIYCYGINATTAGLSVGDEIIVKGNLTVYSSVRELDSSAFQTRLSTGIALVYTTMTTAEVEAMIANYWEYQGKLVTVTGLTVSSYSGNNAFLNWGVASTTNYYLEIYNQAALVGWMQDVYPAASALPEFSFIFYNIYSTVNYNIEAVTLTMTDQQKADYDIAAFPSSLELTLDYSYPTAKYGSAFSSVIAEALNGYLANAVGGYTVTLPNDSDKSGTVTVTATVGSATASKDVTVTVKYLSEADKVAAAKADILSDFDGKTYNPADVLDLITSGLFGTTVSWVSDNAAIDAATGLVGSVSADVSVVLTATVTLGSTSDTAVCTVTVTPHVLYYSTGFEDLTSTDPAGLSGYTDTAFVTNSESWLSYYGYRGTSSDDKKVDLVSIRIQSNTTESPDRYGYIQTAFSVVGLSKISVDFADYKTNTKGALQVLISKDGTNWVSVYVDTSSTSVVTAMNTVVITINYSQAEIVAAGITSSDAVYVRFMNNLPVDNSGNTSINVDQIFLYRIPA